MIFLMLDLIVFNRLLTLYWEEGGDEDKIRWVRSTMAAEEEGTSDDPLSDWKLISED